MNASSRSEDWLARFLIYGNPYVDLQVLGKSEAQLEIANTSVLCGAVTQVRRCLSEGNYINSWLRDFFYEICAALYKGSAL